MVGAIGTLVPDSIDGLLRMLEGDENEQYLLTLLHKTDNSIYCFLSGNLQGIDSGQKIPFGVTLPFSKKNDVKAHYDVEFVRKDVDNGHYFLFKSEGPLGESKPKVIPFLYENKPPYAVVDRGLKQMLMECAEMGTNNMVDAIEHIGQHGVVKGIITDMFNKELKKKRALVKEAEESLRSRVSELFHEYESPSTLIHPIDYRPEDRKKKTMFVKQGSPKYLLMAPLIISLLSVTPYSMLIEEYRKSFQTPYEKRFKLIKSKEEEARILLSDFALAHPKAINGFVRIMEFMKHTANVTTYAAFAGLTAVAYQYAHWGLSYPMMAVSSLSGLTMLGNAIRSHGRDSSGIISTFFEHILYNKLA